MLRSLKVIPLGGVEEIGFNATLVEYGNSQILIDAGLGFPNGELYGVDYIIPNISYLKKNKRDLKVVITHGHLDHIGALPFILPELNYPEVYCTKLAYELIVRTFERNNFDIKKVVFKIVDFNSRVNLGDFSFHFFGVNHSIPEAMGIIVDTDQGSLIFTGDFKFDNKPELNNRTEFEKLVEARRKGVLALFSDSTNSYKKGSTPTENSIYINLLKIIKESKGRIIVSTFSSLLSRIIQLIKIAQNTDRRVMILGRSMQNMVDIAFKLGYLKIDKSFFIQSRQAKSIPDNKIMIIATGAQGEAMAALSRIANGDNRDVKIKKNDTVILSSSIIPGNDLLVQNLIDTLFKLGANVNFGSFDMDLHTSGHAYQEDQKMMLRLTGPKYFIPIHGFQSFLYRHAKTAEEVGMNPKNIIIPLRGNIISFLNRVPKVVDTISAFPVYVSGKGIGDVGVTILAERQQLANSGTVIISMIFNKSSKVLITNPEVYIKGFVYIKDNQKLIDDTQFFVSKLIKNINSANQKQLSDKLVFELQKYLFEKTGKNPLIVPLINYI